LPDDLGSPRCAPCSARDRLPPPASSAIACCRTRRHPGGRGTRIQSGARIWGRSMTSPLCAESSHPAGRALSQNRGLEPGRSHRRHCGTDPGEPPV